MKVKKILILVLVVLISLQVGAQALDKNGRILPAINTQTQNSLDLKANLNSPALTGVPVAPTAAAATNTAQIATTAFVTAAASSSNFVDLTTIQTVAGAKTFSKDIRVNQLTVGRGGGNFPSGVAVGASALGSNTTGEYNTAIGYEADVSSPSLINATAIGASAKVATSNTIQLGNTAINDVKTSGALTTGTVTYPNTHNATAGEVLTTDAFGVASWGSPAAASSYNGVLPLANGGTGSSTQNFADLTTAQTIAGDKKFSSGIIVDGLLNVGLGNGGDYTSAAVGANTLSANVNGTRNTAIGSFALNMNTASNNTAIGYYTLQKNTTGYSNVAVGAYAGDIITTGSQNTLLGREADPSSLDGINQTVIGYNAIGAGNNTVQLGNTAVTLVNTSGTLTAKSLSTTSDITVNSVTFGLGGGNLNSNLALGISALAANTTGTYNTAVGSAALGSNIAGAQNSAFGSQALKNNLSNYGSAFGFQALMNNTTGHGNTAVGYHSLKSNTTGLDNTAIGQESLLNNLDGKRNAALGKYALKDNTANDNTAVGYAALQSNTTGDLNVAIGKNALAINETGTLNTAVGAYALPVSKDSYNTAIGVNTLYLNTYGSYNTAVGRNALYNNNVASAGIPGGENSAFGNEALKINTTGFYNTAIGAKADVGSANLTNTTAIGYGAIVSADNTIRLGNANVANVNTGATMNALAFNSTSDVRLKTNIVPILDGLSTIMKLNPVHYNKKNSLASTDYSTTENGFIAQELQKIIPFVVKEGLDTEKLLSVNYTSIIPILTKAIQEQQKQIEAQNKKLDALEVLVKELIAEKK